MSQKKKGLNEEQILTAVLVGGLGIDKDKRSTYIVYKVSPDRGYSAYKASRERRVNLLINTRFLQLTPGFLPLIHAYNGPEA